METTTLRLPEEVLEEIESLSREEGRKRSELLRELIGEGLREHRVERAVEAYRAGEASQGRAAELAGIPLSAFHRELKRRGVTLRTTPEELAEEAGDLL